MNWKECTFVATITCGLLQFGPESTAWADFSHDERWASDQGAVITPASFVVGDFDGSGTDDLAYIFDCGGQVCIDVHASCTQTKGPASCRPLIPSGNSGAFELERWISNAAPWPSTYQAVAGDFNADGRKDIAIVFNTNGFISIDVYESQPGSASFAGPYHRAQSQGSWVTPGTFLAGNFDGVGADDIAFVFEDGTSADIDVHGGPSQSCSGSSCPSFTLNRWESRNETFASSPSAWLSPGDLDFASGASPPQADLMQVFGTSSGIELDVELASSSSFSSNQWNNGQGAFLTPSVWTSGNMGGRASAIFAFDDQGNISIDTHVSLGSQFGLYRFASAQGSWISGMQFFGGDFNGDGQGDVGAYFVCDAGLICLDVHVNNLVAPEGTGCGALEPGTELALGGTLASCDGRFTLTMQNDGNLVLYNGPAGGPPTSALWASNTSGSAGMQAVMGTDGNLVIFDSNRNQVWSSGTGGHAGAFTFLSNDGTMFIYDIAGNPLWHSLTTSSFDTLTNGGCCPAEPNVSVSTSLVGAMDQNQANFYRRNGTLDHSFPLPGGSSRGGDTKIVFDRSSGRWFISVLWTPAGAATDSAVKFFVSTNASASTFIQTVPIATTAFIDDPNITVTTDKVVVSGGPSSQGINKNAIWVIDKSALTGGTGLVTQFTGIQAGDQIWGVQYGNTTPSTAYMVGFVDASHINWISVTGTPSGRNLGLTQHIQTIPTLANAPSIVEPGGNTMENPGVLGMWQNNQLWWSRTEGCGSFTCVRMFDINTSTNTVNSFDFSMPNTYLWAAAPGIDKNGNMWAIMSITSPTIFPGLAVGGQLANGLFRAPAPIVSGISTYTGSCDSTGFCRWGDFFGAAQDPSDGTVWMTSTYASQNNDFGIKMMHVQSWK